jgi:hypothetical protein
MTKDFIVVSPATWSQALAMEIILAKSLEVRQPRITPIDLLHECSLSLEDSIPLVLWEPSKFGR